MDWLIWIGAAITLAGVGLLVWCIRLAAAARRGEVGEAEGRARLQRLVALNLGALALSGLGLAMVVAGIALG